MILHIIAIANAKHINVNCLVKQMILRVLAETYEKFIDI
jgi:hypothetical protein